jgi:hypothetical protein
MAIENCDPVVHPLSPKRGIPNSKPIQTEEENSSQAHYGIDDSHSDSFPVKLFLTQLNFG